MSLTTIAIDARLVGGSSTGDSTYWTCLVDALARLESDFRLLLISNAPAPENIPQSNKISWQHIPAKSSRWWSLVQFPLAARKAGAAATHTQYTLSPLVGKRGITTIHDVSFLIDPSWFRPRDRLLLSKTVPASARRAGAILTVSRTSQAEIERLIPASLGKVTATRLACPPWIRQMDRTEAKAKVVPGYGLDKPYLLTVGTRWPRKNLALALEAFRLARPNIPHELIITGKFGWGDVRAVEGAQTIGYVPQEDLSALYAAADLFLVPSRHEGFGIPVLEAWRAQTPVLCSSGGALPEVAGDAAFVETSWEPASWAASIERLLGDAGKLESMRRLGEERERLFTWEQTARETLAVYQEVANGRA